MTDKLLTLDEVAASVPRPVQHSTALRWVHQGIRGVGKLPAVRVGRRILVRPEALKQWLADQNGGVDVI